MATHYITWRSTAMGSAKDLLVKPISASYANKFIKAYHYSGKVVPNSKVHFGVFANNKVVGVLQFGSSINKKGTINTVPGTGWNDFIELNRMAFIDDTPKNSESRVIAVCLRLLKKANPHLKWVVSFADATTCGTGTIYRASGFKLNSIAVNTAIRVTPSGQRLHVIQAHHLKIPRQEWSSYKPVKGYQLKYIYIYSGDYTGVKTIPFSKLDELTYPKGVTHHYRQAVAAGL